MKFPLMGDFTLSPYNPLSFIEQEGDVFEIKLRHKDWYKTRLEFVRANPFCAVCGLKTELEVHHIRPFEYWPELELSFDNLVTLCMDEKRRCHFIWGHLFSWRRFNPGIINMLSLLKQKELFVERDEKFFREYGHLLDYAVIK